MKDYQELLNKFDNSYDARNQIIEYLEKYWLDKTELVNIWVKIKNTIFKGNYTSYPDGLLNEDFNIMITKGGFLFDSDDFEQLQLAILLTAAGLAECPGAALADAWYWSEANVTTCARPEGPELLIATTKDWKQRKALREQRCPRGRIPEHPNPRQRMERKLLTHRGRRLYRLRGITVEPVLGQVKEGQGILAVV